MNALLRIAGLAAGGGAGGRCRWSPCSTAGSAASAGRCARLRVHRRVRSRSTRRALRAAVLPHAQRGFFAVDLDACAGRGGGAAVGGDAPKCASAGRTCWKCASVEHRPFARWGEDRLLSEQRRAVPGRTASRCRRGLPLLRRARTRACRRWSRSTTSRAPLFVAAGLQVRERARWTRAAAGRSAWPTAPRSWSAAASARRAWRASRACCRSCSRSTAQRLARADLRYTNGFALTWARSPQPEPAMPAIGQRRRPAATHPPRPRPGIASTARQRHRMNRKGDKSLIVGLDIGTSKVVALVGEYSPGAGQIEVIGIGSHESRGLQARRGGGHRIHRAVDPARDRGSRADGRLRDPLGLRLDLRQPHAVPQLAGHRADPRRRGDLRRPRPRAGGGQGGRDPGRPEDPARDPARIRARRLAGRHPQPGRHDRRAPGSARAPGGLRAVGRRQHQQVRAALRPAGRRPDPGRRWLPARGADQPTSASSAWCWSTSAPAPPTSRCSCRARSRTRASLPIAGDKVTKDIAHMLRTPTPEAEQIKVRYACALAQLATAEESHPGPERRRPSAAPPAAPRRWRRRCRRATRKSSRWCRPNCAAPASSSSCAPAWC